MKRFIKMLFVGSAALLFATTAQAQVTSTSTPGASPMAVGVDITLSGTIVSSLVLTVSGTVGNALSGAVNRTYDALDPLSRATANFVFPTVNTQSGFTAGPVNGAFYRAASGTPGAFVVASLSATVVASGVPAAPAVTVTAGAGTNVPAGAARFFAGAGTWSDSGDNAIGAGGDLCSGPCTSGNPYPHQLGVFLPDSQPSGAFSQIFMYDAAL